MGRKEIAKVLKLLREIPKRTPQRQKIPTKRLGQLAAEEGALPEFLITPLPG